MAAHPKKTKAVISQMSIASLKKPNWFSVALVLLTLMLVYLQAILWIGEGSLAEVSRLKKSIIEKEEENKVLKARNQKLIEEVHALKNGLELIEHKAREDLGLVKEDEIFYHVIDRRPKQSAQE